MASHPGTFILDSMLVFSHFADAVLADILAAVGDQAAGGSAENTGGLELLQDDPVILHENFQFVALSNIQSPPQFDRQHDSAELIHFTDNTSRLHSG